MNSLLKAMPFAGALLSAGLLAGCQGSQSSREPYRARFHLVNHLEEATAVQPSNQPLRVPWIEVGFDRQRGLSQHPPSVYRFDEVPSGEGALFRAAPTMTPRAWTTETDGVGFAVRCRTSDGEWADLLEAQVSPASRPDPDSWPWQEASLAACSAPKTSIELQTTCGPANDCRWDWAAWGDPKIVFELEPELEVRRLVFLISIDTLRPDRTSLYGASRSTSPELEKLAADGVVFETAVAPAPWTIPSHASLLTSTDPDIHGATSQHDIHPDLPLVSEVLREAGWTTAGFVDTPWLGNFGFDRGYDHYDAESPPQGSSRRGVEVTLERLLDWLGEAEGDVFVFWHIMDVHGPYGAPAPLGGRFRSPLEIASDGRLEQLRNLAYHDYLALGRFRSLEDLMASYDEGIAHVDAEIGRLFDRLRRGGLYDDALIAVTSDHGESFMDHGVWVGHGLFLTEDEIRIPLVVKLPGNQYAGTRVGDMVRLTDVAPTLLDVVGVPSPRSFEGLSLVSPRPGVPGSLPRAAFGASSNTGARYVRQDDEKLITPWTIPRTRVISAHLRPEGPLSPTARIESDGALYDLASDPEEEDNLRGTRTAQDREQALQELLNRRDAWLVRLREGLGTSRAETELTPEEARRLRSLGYLGGSDN